MKETELREGQFYKIYDGGHDYAGNLKIGKLVRKSWKKSWHEFLIYDYHVGYVPSIQEWAQGLKRYTGNVASKSVVEKVPLDPYIETPEIKQEIVALLLEDEWQEQLRQDWAAKMEILFHTLRLKGITATTFGRYRYYSHREFEFDTDIAKALFEQQGELELSLSIDSFDKFNKLMFFLQEYEPPVSEQFDTATDA